MSDFDDWLSKNHPSTWPVVLRNGKEYLAADVEDLKAAYNAGMERAGKTVDVLRQTLAEVAHAQQSGARWYTKGHKGLYQQIALWVRKGNDAIKDFDAIRKEIK